MHVSQEPDDQAPHSRWKAPLQPTQVVGRDQDIARLSDIVLRPECRLLTVSGLGGMGKTRLALAVAEAVADNFRDGVCFVDLTRVSHADMVPFYVAEQLDSDIKDLDTEDRIYQYLSDRQMLLVLDNFEHVLPAALVVGQILEACSGVTVLATSREPLHLRWEWRVPI